MPRPPEFDRAKALNRALSLFWHKGYQASSLTELLAVMGIGRSSFYAAFIDKRTLYISCLDLFATRVMGLLQHARQHKPSIDVLQDFFEGKLISGRGARQEWGCMLVNSVLELAGVDEDLVERANVHLDALQAFFRDCLTEAGATPEQADELAAMLMLFNEGIRVSSRRPLGDMQRRQGISTTFRLIRSVIA